MLIESQPENQPVQTFTACFLYPGVARYDKDTTLKMVLIDKHIDSIAKSFIGSPVTIGHTEPADLPLGDSRIVGMVTNVFQNIEGFTTNSGIFVEPDSKYYCDFYVNTPAGMAACESLGFVSCAWEGVEFIRPELNENGQYEKLTYINVEYEAELKQARGLHMALVEDPRYEQSIIFKNSMSGEIIKQNENKEVTSSIEIQKGIVINYVSSKAEQAKDLVLSIFKNAKYKKNEDSYDDDEEEENSKKKAKNAKKMKSNESEEEEEEMKKMEKKENVQEGWTSDWGESEKDKVDAAKGNKKSKKNESEEKDEDEKEEKKKEEKDNKKKNSVTIDGDEVSSDILVELYRNSKKEVSVKTNSGFSLGEARDKSTSPAAKSESTYVNGKDLFR